MQVFLDGCEVWLIYGEGVVRRELGAHDLSIGFDESEGISKNDAVAVLGKSP